MVSWKVMPGINGLGIGHTTLLGRSFPYPQLLEKAQLENRAKVLDYLLQLA